MANHASDSCSVVAFYGCRFTPDKVKRLYVDLIAWLEALGAPPDRLGVSGEGFSGKAGSFRSNDARLRKAGFSAVTDFSIFHLKPSGEVPLWDWRVNADVSIRDAYCVVGLNSVFFAQAKDALACISRTIIGALAPTYGIGFHREMRLGPTLYAAGLCQGLQPWGADRAEVKYINKWGDVGVKNRVYERGLLRDVYPQNYLTEVQLLKQIDETSLKHWIERDRTRGTLSLMGDGMFLWEVLDSQISSIRSVLESAGLIFNAGSDEDI